MKYNIRGNKLEVTDAINEYIKTKLARVTKYLDDNDEVEAKALISAKGKDQKVEVTIWSGKYNVRAEETNSDLYAAIDLVVDKLEKQFRRYKDKISSLKNKVVAPDMEIEDYFEEDEHYCKKKRSFFKTNR